MVMEDGTIDVEGLLVEPQDGHVSMDSVMCFNEKITWKAMDMEDISRNFGVINTGIAQEREDILDQDVLDSVRSGVEVGYFRLQNDFCSMGEDYFQGVGFSESITNLHYGPSEGLPTSVSDSSDFASSASPWKSDIYRIMELPEYQNHQLNINASEFCEVTRLCHGPDEKPPGSPMSCNLQDIGKFHDISSCTFQDILSDGNDTVLSPPVKMFCNPKNEKNDECGPTGQNGEPDRLETVSTQANCSGDVTTQKRSRRPTQRYIDELVDPILRYSKKRREFSSSAFKDKSVVVKDHKNCRVGSRAMALPVEESSVVAIQVPFGSLVHKECPKSSGYDMNKEVGTSYKQPRSTDRRNPVIKSEDNRVTTPNQKRKDERTPSLHLKKRDYNLTVSRSRKKSDLNVTVTHVKKRNESLTAPSQKKKKEFDPSTSPKKTDDCLKTVDQKKKDDCPTEESSEEISGRTRRKHHRLWSVAEVKKLIDGVSEYGVGRWSRIKKLLFSASAHRTSVDLKDKWRNLLKTSRMQLVDHRGEKKRNLAWRPLPKTILRRVCDLANMYPYPKCSKRNIRDDSPDQSTDITLSDYRRILRSINGT